MSFDPGLIREALLNVIIIIVSLALHEWGHAYMADRLGDDTPRSQGRVTLNPLAHIDPIGTVLLPLLGSLGFFGRFGVIGWAKPVQTTPRNFRNGIRDQAWVTIAGPLMNFFLALGATFAAAVAHRFCPSVTPLFQTILTLNVALIVFNLLPVPPLDGSKFLMYWFGMSEESYQRFAQWGWIALLLLINLRPFQILMGTLFALVATPFDLLYRLIT
jgi:Zn-dependent protease